MSLYCPQPTTLQYLCTTFDTVDSYWIRSLIQRHPTAKIEFFVIQCQQYLDNSANKLLQQNAELKTNESLYNSQPTTLNYLCQTFQTIDRNWIQSLVQQYPTANIDFFIAQCRQYISRNPTQRPSLSHTRPLHERRHNHSCHCHNHAHSHYHPPQSDDEKPSNAMDNMYTFKEFEGRLIGCNGDCGSRLSKVIDVIADHHHKVM